MKYAELGVAYVFVLGLEAVLAFCFGALFFGESVSVAKLLGVVLIIGGFALLHVGAAPGTLNSAATRFGDSCSRTANQFVDRSSRFEPHTS